MIKRLFKALLHLVVYALISTILLFGIPRLFTELYARSRLYTVQNAPTRRVAIVFGAGLLRDGSPTPVLRDRVATAVDLYRAGKVEKLLMSGDNRFVNYNEPGAMRAYALSLGVPADDIVLDYAGRRTYDTCYRASAIFGVPEAVLITQGYHLRRALFLCNQLGVPAVGVSSDRREYRRSSYVIWNIREMPATLVALWEAWVSRPLPVLGSPEPIFPSAAQNQ